MKIQKRRLMASFAALVFASATAGDADAQVPVPQPPLAGGSQFMYSTYSQDGAPAAPAPAAGAPVAGNSCGCSTAPSCESSCQPACNSCNTCCEDECSRCEHGEPFKLFESCYLEEKGINIFGFATASFAYNADNTVDNFNGPVTFPDRDSEGQLNQLWLDIEKATDGSDCEWDFGYRASFLYGTDYRFNTAAGLERS